MKSRIKIIPTLAAVACICLLGGCEARTETKPTPTQGNWSKWGEPKITSDMWEGTTIWQTRTNLDTGEVELRAQTASPKGGYYK